MRTRTSKPTTKTARASHDHCEALNGSHANPCLARAVACYMNGAGGVAWVCGEHFPFALWGRAIWRSATMRAAA